ncbi:MAG: hypothetical protein Tsb0013_23560 [Phycisphaerales bacterium]
MTGGAMIDTKKAQRRELTYDDLEAFARDVEAVRAAHDAGTLAHTGNWNAGQCFWHLATFMRMSMDGFPDQKPPFLLRFLGKHVFKKLALSGKPAKPGFKLPAEVAWLDPVASGVGSFEEGYEPLKAVIDRYLAGERFTQDSPIFGPLSHEQWCVLHRGHNAMHMAFQHPTGVEGAGAV